MRQLSKAWVFLLAATTALLATGCSSMSSSATENIESIQQQLLGDMPLPKGSRIDNNQSLILGGGPNWTGRIVILAQQGPTQTFSYFRDQFPAAGWTGISSVKGKTSILVFVKQERTLTIELTESGVLSNGTVVFLTAAPKVVSSPVVQDASRSPR